MIKCVTCLDPSQISERFASQPWRECFYIQVSPSNFRRYQQEGQLDFSLQKVTNGKEYIIFKEAVFLCLKPDSQSQSTRLSLGNVLLGLYINSFNLDFTKFDYKLYQFIKLHTRASKFLSLICCLLLFYVERLNFSPIWECVMFPGVVFEFLILEFLISRITNRIASKAFGRI